MTQPLAYWLGGVLLCALALDVALYGSEHMIFLGKKLFTMIHWLAFWR